MPLTTSQTEAVERFLARVHIHDAATAALNRSRGFTVTWLRTGEPQAKNQAARCLKRYRRLYDAYQAAHERAKDD